jgi:hypothetical protein
MMTASPPLSSFRQPLAAAHARRLFIAIGIWSFLGIWNLDFGFSVRASAQQPAKWDASVVTVEATRKLYDYFQPWQRRSRTVQKFALVTGPRELLTTAEELNDLTVLRLQKNGRGKWVNGRVEWIDYHANLALIACDDAAFWQGLKPAELSTKPLRDNLQFVRWKSGSLETRKAEFNQFNLEDGRLTFINHLQMDVGTEMDSVGWAEPLVSGRKVAGLATGSSGNNVRVLPSNFIAPILEARRRGAFRGLGYFPFVWQPTENPDVHKHLKLDGEARGVAVIEVPNVPGDQPVVQPRDLILQVEGFDVDVQGFYVDPDCGPLLIENLATRRKFAGDEVRLKVWRDGRALDFKYRLPRVEYAHKLLPEHLFDSEPEYLVAGGLVFQPLSNAYLRGFGADWKRVAPFRLNYFNKESPSKERPSLVFLSVVLPDPYNLGYTDGRFLVVDAVNGRKVATVADVQEALKSPQDGFHVVEFMRSDSLRRMVLDASGMSAATARVLQRYQIPAAAHIAKPAGSVALRTEPPAKEGPIGRASTLAAGR